MGDPEIKPLDYATPQANRERRRRWFRGKRRLLVELAVGSVITAILYLLFILLIARISS